MAVVDKPWDGSAGRFTDEQYQSSCVLDRKGCGSEWASKPPKERCSLPIKEPNGDINKNGVHAAAGMISKVKGACPSAIASAKSSLRSAYKTIGDPVPPELGGGDQKKSVDLEAMVREFVVMPGVPRHGEARRWLMSPDEAAGTLLIRSNDDADLGDDYIALLEGHFARFNSWTEINSFFEGRFMESIAPGAFTKTFQENVKNMRCLVQHGRDPQIGMKPLGPIRSVGEDDEGAAYQVPMIDTSYNRDLLPGLKNNLYGASFRFQVIREDVNTEPERSASNPDGIEERVIREAKVMEFGPVTFPAYADATAGARSLEDWWHGTGQDADPVRLAELRSAIDTLRVQVPAETRSQEQVEEEQEERSNAAPPEEDETEETTSGGNLRTNRLSGAAGNLRTGGDREPSWKL